MRAYEPPTRDRHRRTAEVVVLLLAIPTVSLGLTAVIRGLRFSFHVGDIFLVIAGVVALVIATLVLIKRVRRRR